ncbi:MAG TPA: prepilin-type N-terminal cleavage/methylation domain-containing protein [Candidatus Krumholzibacteria bacterium]|nr:prepilin-type N-terminal cleavage/methylation domain-containing protein [Candidatus Krumholzibacteria bacterium]
MNWRNQQGVGLVEIMVALLIFGIGVVAAVRMLPQSSVKTTHSRNKTTAVNIAQEKMEELMADGFKDADLDPGVHDDPLNPISGHFNRSWTITDSTPVDGMKLISVTVTFPTAGADSAATLRTYKSSRQ